MIDIAMAARTRLVAGARVERFDQTVTTQDPFGLFASRGAGGRTRTPTCSRRSTSCRASARTRTFASATARRSTGRSSASWRSSSSPTSSATARSRATPTCKRALIQNVDGRWEMFGGGRGVVAASVFYKYFDKPIERVVIAAANPIATFQNSDNARNFGIELEAGHQVGQYFFLNANYTFVDSKITLLPEQLGVQTSSERAAGRPVEEPVQPRRRSSRSGASRRGCCSTTSATASRTSAPTRRRTSSSRGAARSTWCSRSAFSGFGIRLNLENLTDTDYLFTQTLTDEETQRLYKLGRTVALSFGYNVF